MNVTDPFGEVVEEPLTRIRQIEGQRLHTAWTQIPHVTHHDEADITALDAGRRTGGESGTGKSLLGLIAHAAVQTLLRHPRMNATLSNDGRSLQLKQYVRLGIASEAPRGLLVGVVGHADQLDEAALSARIDDLASRGRAGKLTAADMEGASFTISSLGSIGGTRFTPIINPPNVALTGVCRARLRPTYIGTSLLPRLWLSLSYDHRAIAGADAARFLTDLYATLADAPALP